MCDTTQLTGRREPDDDGYLGHAWELPFPVPTILIRGGNRYEFHHPIRPDDLIRTVWRLDDIVERVDAGGRPMAIVTTTATYHHERSGGRSDDDLLATNTETLIHRPIAESPSSQPPAVEGPPADPVGVDDPRGGPQLPDLVRTLGPVDLVAYGAATWDWHRLHHDPDRAAAAGFGRPVVDGQMLGALLMRHVLDWAPDGARLARLHFRNRAPVLSGATVTCSGQVVHTASDGATTVEQQVLVDGKPVVAPAGATVVPAR